MRKPFLIATKVAVCDAIIVGPSGSPLSQSRPDGISTASTGVLEALRKGISSSNGAASGRDRPVPKSESTTHPASITCLTSDSFHSLPGFSFEWIGRE